MLLFKATASAGDPAAATNSLIYSDIPDMDYVRVGEDYYKIY